MFKSQREGIVSLLEIMRQFNALVFCHLGMILENYIWDKPGSDASLSPAPPFDQRTNVFLFPMMNDLEQKLREIELNDSASTCSLIKARISLGNLNRANLDGLLGELHRNFTRETNKEKFLKIDRDKASLYKPATILSELARMAFKESEVELLLAATSYAVGLDTASVFHSMRSLEKPIQALAKKLRIKLSKEIELATWGEIHTPIKNKTERLRNSRHTKARDEQIEVYSNAGLHFGYLKDGWRNYVSHSRKSYGPLDALMALQHSTAFIEKLAPHL